MEISENSKKRGIAHCAQGSGNIGTGRPEEGQVSTKYVNTCIHACEKCTFGYADENTGFL